MKILMHMQTHKIIYNLEHTISFCNAYLLLYGGQELQILISLMIVITVLKDVKNDLRRVDHGTTIKAYVSSFFFSAAFRFSWNSFGSCTLDDRDVWMKRDQNNYTDHLAFLSYLIVDVVRFTPTLS